MSTNTIIALSLLATGCSGASLTMPTPSQQSRIEEARATILSSTDPLPFPPYGTVGSWFRERVDGIYLDDTRPGLAAYRQNNRIYVSSQTATLPLQQLAGLLMHEARHADVGHTCAVFYDQTLEEWGSWAVQAWWLGGHGYEGDAASIRREQICQK